MSMQALKARISRAVKAYRDIDWDALENALFPLPTPPEVKT